MDCVEIQLHLLKKEDADVENNCNCDNILNLCPDDRDYVHNLKNKISCEFMDLLLQVERGHYPDYEFILEEISLLEILNYIDRKEFILQYYLNNPWKTF